MTVLRMTAYDLCPMDEGCVTRMEEQLQSSNISELAFIDTNVFLTGNYPKMEIHRISRQISLDRKFRGASNKSWKGEVKFQIAVTDWIKNWDRTKKATAPVLTSNVLEEAEKVYERRKRTSIGGPLRILREFEDDKNAFYVRFDVEGRLPTDIIKNIGRYMKEQRQGNDLRLMGTAYLALIGTYNLDVTVVSDDSDFNQMVQGVFKDNKTENGRYLHLERSREFAIRTQLPTPQMFREDKRRYGR